MNTTADQLGDRPPYASNRHKDKKSKKTLPSIMPRMMIPDFPDAGDTTDSVDRGFSAFTKSQIMDNDTQTNFNIIDYDGKLQSQEDDFDLMFGQTIKSNLGLLPIFKTVTFDDTNSKPQTQTLNTRTNSQLLREQQESKEWYELAKEIVKSSESSGGVSRQKVNIPMPLLE